MRSRAAITTIAMSITSKTISPEFILTALLFFMWRLSAFLLTTIFKASLMEPVLMKVSPRASG